MGENSKSLFDFDDILIEPATISKINISSKYFNTRNS